MALGSSFGGFAGRGGFPPNFSQMNDPNDPMALDPALDPNMTLADPNMTVMAPNAYEPQPPQMMTAPEQNEMSTAKAMPVGWTDAMVDSITNALLGWANTPDAKATPPAKGYPTPNNQLAFQQMQQQMQMDQDFQDKMMFDPLNFQEIDEPMTTVTPDDPNAVNAPVTPATTPTFSPNFADMAPSTVSPNAPNALGLQGPDDTSQAAPSFGFGVLGSTTSDADLSGAPAPGEPGYGTLAEAVSPTMGFADAEAAATNEAAGTIAGPVGQTGENTSDTGFSVAGGFGDDGGEGDGDGGDGGEA